LRNHLVSRDKLAKALNVPPEHFDSYIARLAHLGFPKPATEDGSHWEITDVLEWVVDRHESLAGVISHIANWLDPKEG